MSVCWEVQAKRSPKIRALAGTEASVLEPALWARKSPNARLNIRPNPFQTVPASRLRPPRDSCTTEAREDAELIRRLTGLLEKILHS